MNNVPLDYTNAKQNYTSKLQRNRTHLIFMTNHIKTSFFTLTNSILTTDMIDFVSAFQRIECEMQNTKNNNKNFNNNKKLCESLKRFDQFVTMILNELTYQSDVPLMFKYSFQLIKTTECVRSNLLSAKKGNKKTLPIIKRELLCISASVRLIVFAGILSVNTMLCRLQS